MLGSRTLWNDLLTAGLVDQMYLMMGAAVLGGGTPAFTSRPTPPLRLVDVQRATSANSRAPRGWSG